MATGWSPEGLTQAEIDDGEAYHRALYLDGDISRPAGWHRDSVKHLLDLALPHIDEGSLVVDYGSGTGGSAIELLKELCDTMVDGSLCAMGGMTPFPVRSALLHFPEDFKSST